MHIHSVLVIFLLGVHHSVSWVLLSPYILSRNSAVAARCCCCRDTSLNDDGSVSNNVSGSNANTNVEHSRRIVITTLPAVLFIPSMAHATTGSIKQTSRSSIKPQAAFDGLIKAREELQNAQNKYLSKKDYNGLREYLNGAEYINSFEPNALAILASKKLE